LYAGFPDDKNYFKKGIAKVKDEKVKHKGNGICPVEKDINNHHRNVDHQFDNCYQQIGIDEADESFLQGLKEDTAGEKCRRDKKEEKERQGGCQEFSPEYKGNRGRDGPQYNRIDQDFFHKG
jgi:hypothetical protein